MSKSRRLSSPSARCPPLRIEWRPSRHGAVALSLLTLLAPFSLLASDLPTPWALAAALPVLVAGGRVTWRYGHQPRLALVVPAGIAPASRDGSPVERLEVLWRGPLAFARWNEGDACRRVVFFPDTLQAPARRALKLAMQRRQAVAGPGESTAGLPHASRACRDDAASVH